MSVKRSIKYGNIKATRAIKRNVNSDRIETVAYFAISLLVLLTMKMAFVGV